MTRQGWGICLRTGFFKLVHMKSLSAHALRSLMVGQRAILESQIRGLAAVLENTIRQFQSPVVRKQRSFAAAWRTEQKTPHSLLELFI